MRVVSKPDAEHLEHRMYQQSENNMFDITSFSVTGMVRIQGIIPI